MTKTKSVKYVSMQSTINTFQVIDNDRCEMVQKNCFNFSSNSSGPNSNPQNDNLLGHFISKLHSTPAKQRTQRKCVRCCKLRKMQATRLILSLNNNFLDRFLYCFIVYLQRRENELIVLRLHIVFTIIFSLLSGESGE